MKSIALFFALYGAGPEWQAVMTFNGLYDRVPVFHATECVRGLTEEVRFAFCEEHKLRFCVVTDRYPDAAGCAEHVRQNRGNQ
jgi:hypothetical protein